VNTVETVRRQWTSVSNAHIRAVANQLLRDINIFLMVTGNMQYRKLRLPFSFNLTLRSQ
jgi:hypothetical protein